MQRAFPTARRRRGVSARQVDPYVESSCGIVSVQPDPGMDFEITTCGPPEATVEPGNTLGVNMAIQNNTTRADGGITGEAVWLLGTTEIARVTGAEVAPGQETFYSADATVPELDGDFDLVARYENVQWINPP